MTPFVLGQFNPAPDCQVNYSSSQYTPQSLKIISLPFHVACQLFKMIIDSENHLTAT